MRKHDIYILLPKNSEVCADTLMNSYWEELFGKVEELLHATNNPNNYCILIKLII